MTITSSTISRAFLNGSFVGGADSCNGMVAKSASYGNPNGIREIILSIVTVGIYSLVKASEMERKAREMEQAIKDLNRQIGENPDCYYAKVCVDGKSLEIEESYSSHTGRAYLCIYLDSREVGRLENTNFTSLKQCLEEEIDRIKPAYVSL
ncbi:hypothetical protein [Paraburkholderia sp. RL17-373-BIF-A]|uniref:hypothetical protein n=1 Tax=Paraburkholderia sp. RL17-373-BIF-A TaxID=3031629 RepID=UPI0038BD075A